MTRHAHVAAVTMTRPGHVTMTRLGHAGAQIRLTMTLQVRYYLLAWKGNSSIPRQLSLAVRSVDGLKKFGEFFPSTDQFSAKKQLHRRPCIQHTISC
jgi:hypothetical protein